MNLTNSDLYFFAVIRWVAPGLPRLCHLWDLRRNLPLSLYLTEEKSGRIGSAQAVSLGFSSLRPLFFGSDPSFLVDKVHGVLLTLLRTPWASLLDAQACCHEKTKVP